MLYTETISREMARVTGLEPATSGVEGIRLISITCNTKFGKACHLGA